MASLKKLKKILEQEGLMDKSPDFESRYTVAVRNKRVRKLLEIETPEITDLTDILEIENNGRLYAVRMDLNKGVDNHKKPVVAGLILRGVLKGKIPRDGIDTLIDGGNFNSAKAVRYYAEKLGMKGMYVMSRLFPQYITDMLESENFHVIRAPKKYDNAREREFYEHLFELMKSKKFRRNKFCLWHARDSGKAMYPFGIETAEQLEEVPDYVISCIGAGSTLEGLQIAIQNYFKEAKPSIIIGEHELSPLFAKVLPSQPSSSSLPSVRADVDPDFYASVEGLPHIAIGPHYDEINPLLSKDSIAKIDQVIQYSDHDWMAMQKYLQQEGISIGNTSAANLNVAANLANEGNNVLTVIFEPFREFYKKRHVSQPIKLRRFEKVAAVAAALILSAAGTYLLSNPPASDDTFFIGEHYSKETIEASKKFFGFK